MLTQLRLWLATLTLAASAILVQTAAAGPPPPSFTITPLLLADFSSEPEISIGNDGTMAMVALAALGTELWTGSFGSVPVDQGIVDSTLQQPGRIVFSGHDADVDIGSTGRLHLTTLSLIANRALRSAQIGVGAITCPSPASSNFSIGQCSLQIIDTTVSDRPWITSDGPRVYISYHDDLFAYLIHVQRSDDDGFSWKRVGDPIVGHGQTTADATSNNMAGNIVADPFSHNVYSIYAAGEQGAKGGTLTTNTLTTNHIIVSRSSDMGHTWTPNFAFSAPPETGLAHTFPALAVDPTNGNLYAVWSDGQTVSLASSTDQGSHWTTAVAVSSAPATTAVFPWVAAYNGTVDVVYYGTTVSSHMDPSADWHLYFAQSIGGSSITQTQVNLAPNHHGGICTVGDISCGPETRSLLDDFQVAINPRNGNAAIIYVDDTLTDSPQSVLAQQN